MTESSAPDVSPIRASLAGRCPRCGKGKLFKGYLKVADRCSVCGLDLSGFENADGPSVFIILILGFVVVGLALVVEVAYMPPFWVHGLLWVPLVCGGVYFMLPPLKGGIIGIHYQYRPDQRDDAP
ncbi:MAG: DUF983 domain-containing protein [Alphaproteobacteria bacterium]|nr:DUF983 domain-containing protein [Alphaproteobacteria bacterium]